MITAGTANAIKNKYWLRDCSCEYVLTTIRCWSSM